MNLPRMSQLEGELLDFERSTENSHLRNVLESFVGENHPKQRLGRVKNLVNDTFNA